MTPLGDTGGPRRSPPRLGGGPGVTKCVRPPLSPPSPCPKIGRGGPGSSRPAEPWPYVPGWEQLAVPAGAPGPRNRRGRGAGRGWHRHCHPPRAGQGGSGWVWGGAEPQKSSGMDQRSRAMEGSPPSGDNTRDYPRVTYRVTPVSPRVTPVSPPCHPRVPPRHRGVGAAPGARGGISPSRIGPGATRGVFACPPQSREVTQPGGHAGTRGDTRNSPAPPLRRGIPA